MYESAPPTEPTLTPSEEYRRLRRRSLWKKMLDRAASDPLRKQQLLDDLESAMRNPTSQSLRGPKRCARVRGPHERRRLGARHDKHK